MALVFAIVIAPNVWWLVNNDFMPFHYVDDRAAPAARWYHYLLFPLRWTGGQLAVSAAGAGACWRCCTCRAAPVKRRTASADAAFNRRYVAALALGPFVVTTVVAAVARAAADRACGAIRCGRSRRWRVLMVWPPALDAAQLRRFAAAALAVLIAFPSALRPRSSASRSSATGPKATQFPGRAVGRNHHPAMAGTDRNAAHLCRRRRS